jgi:phage host-nuclease inhibitor protein Gam
MSSTKKLLDNRLQEDNILSQEVNTKMEKSDERYAALQTNIKNDIQSLKEKEI